MTRRSITIKLSPWFLFRIYMTVFARLAFKGMREARTFAALRPLLPKVQALTHALRKALQ